MPSKLKEIVKSEFKKTNVKSFFFFLFFSSLIWLIVQFSEQHTEILNIPVYYENYPKDKLIEDEKSDLEIRVQQTGFQLAWLKMFRPEVRIDLTELPADSSFLKYSILENYYELAKKIPVDMNKAEFLEKEIRIPYHLKSTKLVPLISNIKINYAPGYASEEKLTLLTDSIQISGSQSVLDSTEQVYTQKKSFKEVNADLLEKVKVKAPKDINLYQDEVYFRIKVERFTEKQMEIPIEVINAPPGIKVSLYPASIDVNFKVSLARYNQIEELDFRIVCDYKDLQEDQKFFIPRVLEKPESIQALQLNPRKIDYIIKK